MGQARPTQASVANVIAAIKAAGLTPGAVSVGADGSFSIPINVDAAPKPVAKSPPKWGEKA